ncbi:MAG: glycosyltransferase family 2 protein [Oscillatoriales cyanobacterium SM2_2_1]|nr:glycosyltransferase family 2 protein [Oscillatoriales cyanobacterium SM2_2_1]
MTEQRVSIVVPAYNMADYLPQTLDSLVTQDHPNFEVIVVDDGSGDRTGEVMADYRARYPQIRYVYQENGGEAAARNRGIAAASGEYLMFVDADDLLMPGAVRILANQLSRLDPSYCLVHGEMEEFDHHTGQPLGVTRFGEISQDRVKLFTSMSNMILASIVRTEAMGAIGNFPAHVKWSAITEVMMALCQRGNLFALDQVVYRYRVRSDSMSRGISEERVRLMVSQSGDRLTRLLPRESPHLQRAAWAGHYQRYGIKLHAYDRPTARSYLLIAWLLKPRQVEPLRLLLSSWLGRW